MKEHPIPQDVTGYKFHIVGNLTLKQFVEVGAGVVIAIILFKLSLPAILKWPLIVISLATGGLGAFVPIAGRSFDQWIITFFKVIYRPSIYYWKREPHIPDIFSFELKNQDVLYQPQADLTPQKHQMVDEYLASVASESTTTQNAKLNTDTNLQPTNNQNLNQQPHKQQPIDSPQAKEDNSDLNTSQNSQFPTEDTQLSTTNRSINAVAAQLAPQTPIETQQATFNQDLPFPTTPTVPNKLVGMVLTDDQNLIPNAIVEVYNQNGLIERAVKSNALGQFFITTPLPNGQYVIKTSKEGLHFEPISLNLNGQIIPPLEIIAS